MSEQLAVAQEAEVITEGRTDIDDLFRISGVLTWTKLNHTPFLAFVVEGQTVSVRIVKNATKLLELTDETKVMVQWKGDWNSDFFHFTVGDVRTWKAANGT